MALNQAVSDAKLWEMRFQAAEKSRETYRESSRRLVQENEQLQLAISQVLEEKSGRETVRWLHLADREGHSEGDRISEEGRRPERDAGGFTPGRAGGGKGEGC